MALKMKTANTPWPKPGQQPVRPDLVIQYEPGEILFKKGDPGGDLLFVEQGLVEIYMESDQNHVVLARMHAGEIIGVMTFLTKDPRMASAKAIEATTVKKIPSVQIQRQIEMIPKWLKIVLKEFVGRIAEMNRMYADATLELRKARELQITPLFLATQMAQALAVVGQTVVTDRSPDAVVAVDALKQGLQRTLNQPKDMIDRLMLVFNDSGLLQLKRDPVTKQLQKTYSLSSLEKAAAFTQFVRESEQGPTKKFMKARFTTPEIAQAKAIAQYAIKKGQAEAKNCTITAAQLEAELEIEVGILFELPLLEKSIKLELVATTGTGPGMQLTLTPQKLLHTMACIEAMRRLMTGADGINAV